jgi:DNA-binding NtrC family response regulator
LFAQHNGRNVRIVIIDDDRDHLHYLLDCLGADYAAVGYQDAATAIASIARHGADLVISGIFMPGMDGFEVLRHLQDKAPSIPVIAIDRAPPTDKSFLEIIKRMGAVDAINRPVDRAELLAAVKRTLG